jgi:hypothetical protein
MEVIHIGDREAAKRKAELLSIIDDLRERVEAGDIDEFVAASIDTEGDVQLHACVKDALGGVGALEIAKQIFISQYA